MSSLDTKRSREEEISTSSPDTKRSAPASGHASSYEQSDNSGDSSGENQKLRYKVALAYLRLLRTRLEKEKYAQFLEVIKEFRKQRIDVPGVATRVRELLQDQRNLILGFNKFLPSAHKITFPKKGNNVKSTRFVNLTKAAYLSRNRHNLRKSHSSHQRRIRDRLINATETKREEESKIEDQDDDNYANECVRNLMNLSLI